VAKTAKPPKKPSNKGALRPVLLAAGLGLFWFVEYQDAGGDVSGPMTAYLVMTGVRLLADFVGAWMALSALQLVFAFARFGVVYLRSLWPQESR
jgi:hypothetical protein